MKAKYLFLLLLCCTISMTSIAQTQDCDCEQTFEWMKKTFEENDAGFQYIIDKKGQAAYDAHNALIREKIKAAPNITECTAILDEWLTFFRKGHIGIIYTGEPQNNVNNHMETAEIQTPEVDLESIKNEIAAQPENSFQGIWDFNPYKLAIRKEGDTYIAYVIESANPSWKPGQVKIKFGENQGKTEATFYMGDHSPQNNLPVELLNDNFLQVGSYILERINPNNPGNRDIADNLRRIQSAEPFIEKLNDNTLYLRIPGFDFEYKSAIDSVINSQRAALSSTPNLIIDLRNNGGGSDVSYDEIIPYLYTNPIRTVSLELRSTPLNNQMFLDIFTNPEYGFDEEHREWARQRTKMMDKHLGEFINPDGETVSVLERDSVYEYPRNVGIIIHERNASSVEQFLMAAKQSRKVKLFGKTTFGAIDISNVLFADSPCKRFKLIYCYSKSLRIPGMIIDDIGLQPDYYIDDEIPSYKWVDYVNTVLNQW